jgi:hypothetical protein
MITQTPRRSLTALAVGIGALALITAACGSTSTPAASTAGPTSTAAPLVTDPYGTTCPVLDSNGYCPGDFPPTTPPPPTQAAPAPTTAPTTTPPTQPAPAPAPPPPAASCHPLSNEGTCYEPGEFCRNADHGVTGVAGDGKTITCEDNDGWRWEDS